MSAGRGFLLIFDVGVGRDGSEYDVQNLTETFERMNAVVRVKSNPDSNAIKGIMAEFKTQDFSPYSYVAVAYLSHGTEDGIVATATPKEILVIQKTILIPLCNIPTLNGKLKWLIMQTCRGKYDFIKEATEGPTTAIQYPCYCAKFFATSEGMRAYRIADEGSFFIRALCNRLRSEYEKNDIISIMNNTSDDVVARCKNTPSIRLIQKPTSEDNFGSKKYYITCGFQSN